MIKIGTILMPKHESHHHTIKSTHHHINPSTHQPINKSPQRHHHTSPLVVEKIMVIELQIGLSDQIIVHHTL